MILDKYIEPSIIRKTLLVKKLWEDEVIMFTMLANELAVTVNTIQKDCDELLNETFLHKRAFFLDKEKIHLRREKLSFSLDETLNHIYNQSTFLKMLSYYLFHGRKKEYKNMYEYFYISRTKYYIERKKIKNYLSDHDLHLKKCQIVGDEYKIIWLKAVLDYYYKLEEISIDEKRNKTIVEFVCQINHLKNVYYSYEQREIFLRIFILALSNKIVLPKALIHHYQSFSNLPNNLIEEIKKRVNSCSVKNTQSLLELLKITLFILNDEALSPKVEVRLRKENFNRFLHNKEVKELIDQLEKTTSIDVYSNPVILNIVHDQLKMMGVSSFIIPYKMKESYIVDNSIRNEHDKIFKALQCWNKDKNLNILDFKVDKLANTMALFKSRMEKNFTIYIVSDSWENFLLVYHLVKENIQLKIDVADMWLTEKHLETLYLEVEDVLFIKNYSSTYSYNKDRMINLDLKKVNSINWEEINLQIMNYMLSR